MTKNESVKFDLSPLRKALKSLEAAIAQPQNEFLRDSVIQRFEYTYELAWKSLKRHLEALEGSETIDALGRKDLFRVGAEKNLIENPEDWFVFHTARNETSHTYNESKAESVYQIAVKFPAVVHELIKKLDQK